MLFATKNDHPGLLFQYQEEDEEPILKTVTFEKLQHLVIGLAWWSADTAVQVSGYTISSLQKWSDKQMIFQVFIYFYLYLTLTFNSLQTRQRGHSFIF